MKNKQKPIPLNKQTSQIISNEQDEHLQTIEFTKHEQLMEKNNKKSSPIKDLRLLLNTKERSKKEQPSQLYSDNTYKNKSIQNNKTSQQKNQQKNKQDYSSKPKSMSNNNNKIIDIKLQKKSGVIKIEQPSKNNHKIKQKFKIKEQDLSHNQTNTKKQANNKQLLKQVRKQTSSTKLSQPIQKLISITQQKSKNKINPQINKNKLSSGSKLFINQNSNNKTIINLFQQKQIANKLQKLSKQSLQKTNNKAQSHKIKQNSITKKQTKQIIQLLSKHSTSPNTKNDKIYQKHDCSIKKIQPVKFIYLSKKSSQKNNESPKKQLSHPVKQLINKLTQSQYQKINKNSKKDFSAILEPKIKLNSFIDNTKVKQVLQNSLIGSQSKGKISKQKSNKKLKKDVHIPIVVPQPQIQIKLQNYNKKLEYSQEDIKRIKFLKKLHNEKAILQRKQLQKKHQQEMQRQKSQQNKKQQQKKLKSQQQQNKRRSISQRIQQIQRRKQQRKNQLIKQNKQYLQKKNEFTLQHKLVNQWLEKQLQQNQIKERQLQAKISKMKPSNLLQEIQQHKELIESYKRLHQSRFMESDLKYEQQKSRLLLSKLYKSNWYKQIRENDPFQTFQIEEEKRRQQKQLLMMKLDNRKKYSQYVKVNYKPDSDQQSTFKYEKRIIADISADKIRRMGLQNLDYSKQLGHTQSQKKFHSQTERNESHMYKNYLQQMKTQRMKKQERSSSENFDNLIQKIKISTTMSKQQKVKKFTELAKKNETKAKQKEQIFNRTNSKGTKLLQKQIQDSKNMKRGTSLPSLSTNVALQPKLKINPKKSISKQKQTTDQLLQQIQSKFKLLQKVGNL